MLQIPPKEWLEAGQSKLRAELGLDQPAPAPVNEGAVLRALAPDVVRFKKIRLRFGPVSYADGVKLQSLMRRLEMLATQEETPEMLAGTLAALHECADLIHKNTRPLSWRHRLLWRLTNPIREANEAEMRFFLRALSMWRMKADGVELLSSIPESASGN